MPSEPRQDYVIIHLQPGSEDWAGLIAQFMLYLAAKEGHAYAAWSADRLLRASGKNEGLVALLDGKMLGITLIEVVEPTAEISLPWTLPGETEVACDLAQAALQVIREEHPYVRFIRSERALLPGETDPRGLQAAGFLCHWRHRMQLELAGWWDEPVVPVGYRLVPWQIRYLDAAASVVFRANQDTLDALLYAPFFGTSPKECRQGLLTILAGSYGALLPQATWCVLHGHQLVGVNLVIRNDGDMASIIEISVDPVYQGRGLGRALMVRSLRELKHEHYERVELAVTSENTGARHLYESLGFTTVNEFPVCIWPGD